MQGSKTVKADAMQIALLDEIAERLLRLEKQLPVKPEGIVEPLGIITATTTPRVVTPPFKRKWFSVSIINDGPNDCWITINTEKSVQPYLCKINESYEVDMGSGVIEDMRVYTESGTASLRIAGSR